MQPLVRQVSVYLIVSVYVPRQVKALNMREWGCVCRIRRKVAADRSTRLQRLHLQTAHSSVACIYILISQQELEWSPFVTPREGLFAPIDTCGAACRAESRPREEGSRHSRSFPWQMKDELCPPAKTDIIEMRCDVSDDADSQRQRETSLANMAPSAAQVWRHMRITFPTFCRRKLFGNESNETKRYLKWSFWETETGR
jgi:hypothetical protein